MTFNVFISYSTKDLMIAKNIKERYTNPEVNIFVAEYSLLPGKALNQTLINEIKKCDMFILLWSKNSQNSEYVQIEIGIAKGNNKFILPFVLNKGLKLPNFIADLKYLPAYEDLSSSLQWLEDHISNNANEQKKRTNLLLLFGISAGLVFLLSKIVDDEEIKENF